MTWTIRRWSESKLAIGKPHVHLRKENAHHVDLEWTEEEEAKLKTIVERYTARGASGAWRVHRWRLACFSSVLGDTKDRNDVSGHWYNEWPLDTRVHSPIFRWPRDTFLPMLFKEPAEYPKPDENNARNELPLHEPESIHSSLPSAPPPHKGVLLCPLPSEVRNLKGWLTKCFPDHLDIVYMYADMGNDERSEMPLKFQDSPNPSVFVTRPKVSGTGLNLAAANNAVISQKFWVLNEQGQAFARVVQLGQNRVPHTWLLNTAPSGYDNRVSDLNQVSGVAQMKVLHGLMSRPSIMTSMIYRILECHEDSAKQLTVHRDVGQLNGGDEH